MKSTNKGLKGIVFQEIHGKLSGYKYVIGEVLRRVSNKSFTDYIRKHAVLKESSMVYNTVTNAGKAQLNLLGIDASAVPFTYIALGSSNTAAAASQTALGTELATAGLSRVSVTPTRTTTTFTNDTMQFAHTFAVSGSATVEEIGIFNAASTGTMLCRAVTGSKSFANGDNYTVTYKVIQL